MPTPPPPISPYATPPTSQDPLNFDARADAKVADDVVKVGEYTALGNNMFANAVEAVAAAAASADAASEAQASAQLAQVSASAAAASAGATAWNPDTNYTLGQRVWSPIDQQLYRRAVPGISPTDPSVDAINWARVWVQPKTVTARSFYL